MKKIKFLLLCLVFFNSLYITSQVLYEVKEKDLDIMSRPDLNSEILGQLQENNIVEVYNISNGWARIKHNSSYAFVEQIGLMIIEEDESALSIKQNDDIIEDTVIVSNTEQKKNKYMWTASNNQNKRGNKQSVIDKPVKQKTETVKINMCNGEMQMKPGVVYNFYDSGGSTHNYSKNENFKYVFQAPDNKRVRIVFNKFSTNKTYNDCLTINGHKFSGTTNPGTITSPDSIMTIEFTSSNGNCLSGWSATVTVID